VLTILQDNNFTVNPRKCEWAVLETDWLGYWLTPEGVKPWRKKVDPILAIQAPTNPKQLRSFIGSFNFYRDMFRQRSHILAPLTEQSGRRSITWTKECQESFDQINNGGSNEYDNNKRNNNTKSNIIPRSNPNNKNHDKNKNNDSKILDYFFWCRRKKAIA
jgi:hypothetical protein